MEDGKQKKGRPLSDRPSIFCPSVVDRRELQPDSLHEDDFPRRDVSFGRFMRFGHHSDQVYTTRQEVGMPLQFVGAPRSFAVNEFSDDISQHVVYHDAYPAVFGNTVADSG
jgi:hypothetical protein